MPVILHIDNILEPSLLFSRLNSCSLVSFSSQQRCSRPLIIMVALHWIISSISTSLLYQETEREPELGMFPHQCWAEEKDCLQWSAGSTPTDAAQDAVGFLCHDYVVLAHRPPSVLMSTMIPNSFSAFKLVAPTHNGTRSAKDAEICSSLWWVSKCSCLPSSPTCWGPSRSQHDSLMYHPLILDLFYILTCWGFMLSHPPQHWWGCHTALVPVPISGVWPPHAWPHSARFHI